MRRALLAAAALLGLAVACRPNAPQKPVFATEQIVPGLYELSFDAGGYPDKVVVSVGDDGLLVVDTGEGRTGQALAAALAAYGKGTPRVVINTHSHLEHMGGNAAIGRGAVIIAHRATRERFLDGLYAIGDFPPSALPNLTFTDSLSLHFNGEDVRLAAFPGAHSDGDIVVLFTRSKVAVVGAVCMGGHFPSVDGDVGDVTRYPEVTARALAWLPEDVRIVPAHAPDCDMAQARRFLAMLRETGAIVKRGMAEGRDLDHLRVADVLAPYRSFESSYVKRGDWLECWYEGLSAPKPARPRPYAPVLAALRARGAVAAVDEYSRLRQARPADWWFEDRALMYMGRRLARLKRDADAIAFLDRCIAEYPGSEGAAVSHDVLATVCERGGDSTRAATHLRAYLERHPGDRGASRRLVADLAARGGSRP
jgi:cyclase